MEKIFFSLFFLSLSYDVEAHCNGLWDFFFSFPIFSFGFLGLEKGADGTVFLLLLLFLERGIGGNRRTTPFYGSRDKHI